MGLFSTCRKPSRRQRAAQAAANAPPPPPPPPLQAPLHKQGDNQRIVHPLPAAAAHAAAGSNSAAAARSTESDPRTVRVFLSSTFRDMQEERNELNRSALPRLRRDCARRGLFLSFIDLRWGITEEEVQGGKVVLLCLREVARARYFVCFMKGRYGWHLQPGKQDALLTTALDAALEEFPWVNQHRDNSVTELEIRLGALLRPEGARRDSLFYLASDALAGAEGEPEGPHAAARLAALKREVAGAGMPTKSYGSHAALAEALHDDLLQLIERDYPRGGDLPWVAEQRLAHDATAEMLRRVFVGRDTHLAALKDYAGTNSSGLMAVVAPEGYGKSALLANFAAQWRAAHPDELVLEHYAGGTSEGGASALDMFRRVREEAGAWARQPVGGDAGDDEIVESSRFGEWLRGASKGLPARLVLVFDAVDRLGTPHARRLVWLPEKVASHRLRIVLSCSQGSQETLQMLQFRDEPLLHLEALSGAERAGMAEADLLLAGKTMAPQRLQRVAGAPQCESPLFLSILLAEIKGDAVFDTLDGKLDELLACRDHAAALRAVVARMDRHYGAAARSLLTALAASRSGLTEAEARDMSGATPLGFAELAGALLPYLANRGGLYAFAHSGGREAVEGHYHLRGGDGGLWRAEQARLAEYFQHQPPSARRWHQLPHALAAAGDRERLREVLLAGESQAVRLHTHEAVKEAAAYWKVVHGGDAGAAGRDLEAAAGRAAADEALEPRARVAACHSASNVCRELGQYRYALGALIPCLELIQKVYPSNSGELATIKQNMGTLLLEAGNLGPACGALQDAFNMWRAGAVPADNDRTPVELKHASAASDLGAALTKAGDHGRAERLLTDALDVRERMLGRYHPLTVETCNNLALCMKHQGNLKRALELLQSSIGACGAALGEQSGALLPLLVNLSALLAEAPMPEAALTVAERALKVATVNYGEKHPLTLHAMHATAGPLAAVGRLPEAIQRYRTVLVGRKALLGPHHPDTVSSMTSLGGALSRAGDERAAAQQHAEALHAAETGPVGREHLTTRTVLVNLGLSLLALGDRDGALPLLMRAAEAGERLEPGTTDTASALSALAGCLAERGDAEGAIPLLERACEAYRGRRGPAHPEAVSTTVGVASLMAKAGVGRAKEAEALLRERIAEARKLGLELPAAKYAGRLALILRSQGREEEAREEEGFAREAAARLRAEKGPGHEQAFAATAQAAAQAREAGREEEATAILWEAVGECERGRPAGGEGPPPILLYLGALLAHAKASQKHGEAAGVLARVVGSMEGVRGPQHASLANPLLELAEEAAAAGDGAAAVQAADRALSLLPPASEMTEEKRGRAQRTVAAAYRAAGRSDDEARRALARSGF